MPRYTSDHDSIARTPDPLAVVEILADEMALPSLIRRLRGHGCAWEDIPALLAGPEVLNLPVPTVDKLKAASRKEEFDRRPLCAGCKRWDKPIEGISPFKPRRPGARHADVGCHGCVFSHLDEPEDCYPPITDKRKVLYVLLDDCIIIQERLQERSNDKPRNTEERARQQKDVSILKRWLDVLSERCVELELQTRRRRMVWNRDEKRLEPEVRVWKEEVAR